MTFKINYEAAINSILPIFHNGLNAFNFNGL